MSSEIKIGKRVIGENHPTYFIADIAANHDGRIERAIELIHLAKKAGADAAKFQNFQAAKIVSDFGFRHLGDKQAHQSAWKKSVFEVYKDYSISQDWTPTLKRECDAAGIDYFSSPYDFESVDHLDPYVDMYKIGSGDITWIEMLEFIARKGKPVMLATGAASIGDVQRAVDAILRINPALVLMQCNTNYTASLENYRFVNLNVLRTYQAMYPNVVLGLSDHTFGLATTLGAVALGGRVIEKHFTDDNGREGPDHKFAMNPATWREMVDRTRELEAALGNGNKKVEDNEKESQVVQQRCLRAARDLRPGEVLTRADIHVLRPAPREAISAQHLGAVIGRVVQSAVPMGERLRWADLGELGVEQ
ncbi:MAG TPA: N-acetylneuraminate synthase family protein [Burkholderiales bacterium]|nr:N-acetylneuraminate synthase family protein [Burkholderiales bacterium]